MLKKFTRLKSIPKKTHCLKTGKVKKENVKVFKVYD